MHRGVNQEDKASDVLVLGNIQFLEQRCLTEVLLPKPSVVLPLILQPHLFGQLQR